MHANFNVILDPEFPCQVKLYSSEIELSDEMCSRTFFLVGLEAMACHRNCNKKKTKQKELEQAE